MKNQQIDGQTQTERETKSPSLSLSLSSPSRYSSVITPVGIMLSVTAFTYLSPSSSIFTFSERRGEGGREMLLMRIWRDGGEVFTSVLQKQKKWQ